MTATVVELCCRARPELACPGELGRPLLAVVALIERVGATRACDALADPAFALDVLTAANGEGDAATVGRVLEFLRLRAGAGPPVGAVVVSAGVTLAQGWSCTRRASLALMADGTQHTFCGHS